jgi:hypothetical protein
MVHQRLITIAALVLLAVGSAVPARSQPARNPGPCAQISAACQGAGFVAGGISTGNGLQADCIVPIMQGRAQPPQARLPLPQIDPRLIAECEAANPRFGEAGAEPAQPRPSAGCALAGDSAPHGLVVVLPPRTQRNPARDQEALNNPFISGAALQVDWRDLEPEQGKPDWSRLDELVAAAQASNKWVQLLIFPGFFSSAWALQGAETDLFPIQYGPGQGTVTRLPMPWDGVYLNRWFGFLKQLSARFGASPAFRMIAADGPTSVSAEMSLPIKRPDIIKWLAHGYSPKRYLDAWEKVFQVYAEDFPNQCISLSAPGLPLLSQGRVIDPAGHAQARQQIIAQASGVLGRRLAIQWSDLHAGRAAVEAPDQTNTVIGYSGRLITGLQMRSAAEGGGSAVMGAANNPPLALRRSVDKGMVPNAQGRHIDYLEIYEPDVLAAEMRPVLRYGASLFARQ